MWSLILICIIHLVVTQQIFCLDTFGYNLENLNSVTIVLWGVYCFRQNFFDVLYKVVYYCVYQCSYFLQNFAIFRLKFSTFWFSIAFFVCNIFSTCKTKTMQSFQAGLDIFCWNNHLFGCYIICATVPIRKGVQKLFLKNHYKTLLPLNFFP